MHFVTAEEEHYDKDGVVWCIDVVKARDLLPDEPRKILVQEHAWLFSIEMLQSIQSIDEFDDLATDESLLLFSEPPSLDGRIVNQGAILSALPGAKLRLSEFLVAHPDLCKRVIIPRV